MKPLSNWWFLPSICPQKTWIYLPNQWNHWKTHTFPASRVFSWLNLLRMVLETQDYPVLARDKPFRSKVISRFGNLFPVSELLGKFSHSQDLRPRDQSTKGVWKVKIVLVKQKHMEFSVLSWEYLQIIQLSPIRRGLVQRSWCCSLTNKRRSDWPSLIVSTNSFDLGAYVVSSKTSISIDVDIVSVCNLSGLFIFFSSPCQGKHLLKGEKHTSSLATGA